MVDRYTRVVLTVIAACLVYLCLVLTPVGTRLTAQGYPPAGAERPGLATGPAEVIIVGWRTPTSDVAFPVVVRNAVTTIASSDSATRVVVAGWEDSKRGLVRMNQDAGLPVDPSGASRPSRVVLAGTEPAPGGWRQRVPVDPSKDGALK